MDEEKYKHETEAQRKHNHENAMYLKQSGYSSRREIRNRIDNKVEQYSKRRRKDR